MFDNQTDGDLLIELKRHLAIAAGIEAELAKRSEGNDE